MKSSNQSPFQQLLTKEMDRKEFLAYAGATVLAVTGISAIAHNLVGTDLRKPQHSGYGASVYGGLKQRR